jgi:hypothetical protein
MLRDNPLEKENIKRIPSGLETLRLIKPSPHLWETLLIVHTNSLL